MSLIASYPLNGSNTGASNFLLGSKGEKTLYGFNKSGDLFTKISKYLKEKGISKQEVVYNQLFVQPASSTDNNITVTYGEDQIIHLNGTTVSPGYMNFGNRCNQLGITEDNNKYYNCIYLIKNSDNRSFNFGYLNGRLSPSGVALSNVGFYSFVGVCNSSNGDSLGFSYATGLTFNDIQLKINIINLTQMFGAGNEPTQSEADAIFKDVFDLPYNTSKLININHVFYSNFGTGKFKFGPKKCHFSGSYATLNSEMGIISDKSQAIFSSQVKCALKLPSDYQEVQYLENSGTQIIDTGYVPNTSTVLDFTFSYSNFSVYGAIYGNYVNESTNVHRLICTASDNNYFYAYSGQIARVATQTPTLAKNTVGVINVKYGSIIINGRTRTGQVLTGSGTINNTKLALFASNTSTPSPVICKIYQFKIADNIGIVRDFVPCYRKSDGKPGMYDTISGTFFTNSGTGEFLLGPSVGVPDDFQQVEYLESTGTQWIDTGTQFGNPRKHQMIVVFKEAGWSYGANSGGQEILLGASTDYLGTTFTESPAWRSDTIENVTVNMVTNNLYLIRNGTTVVTKTGSTNTKKCYLFGYIALSADTTATALRSWVLYSYRVYDSELTIRDFIPCFRISDGVAGLYDVINGTFYTNSGTGEFIVGPTLCHNLGSEYQQLKSISKGGNTFTGLSGVFNQWDEEWENGTFNGDNLYPANDFWRSKNFIRVFPSTNYYFKYSINTTITLQYYDSNKHYISGTYLQFLSNTVITTPASAVYMKFYVHSTTYNHDICINKSDPVLNGLYISHRENILIPCFRNRDNAVGVYDLLSNRFHKVEGATAGEFTGINSPIFPIKPYIGSAGETSISQCNTLYIERCRESKRYFANMLIPTFSKIGNLHFAPQVGSGYITVKRAKLEVGSNDYAPGWCANYYDEDYDRDQFDIEYNIASGSVNNGQKINETRVLSGREMVMCNPANYSNLGLKLGDTINWNQMVNPNSADSAITYHGGYYSLKTNASATYNWIYASESLSLVSGHKYWIRFKIFGVSKNVNTFAFRYNNNTEVINIFTNNKECNLISTMNITARVRPLFYVQDSADEGKQVEYIFMVSDLTTMFGAGKEPTTADNFTSVFDQLYYPQCDSTPMIIEHSGIFNRNYSEFSTRQKNYITVQQGADTTQSISFWIYIPETLPGSGVVFADKSSSIGFGFSDNGSKIVGYVGEAKAKYLLNNKLLANQWNHIVLLKNGNCYINNQVLTRDSATGMIVHSGNGIQINGTYNGSTYGDFFDGYLSDLRLYNNALTATEVATLYNQGRH